MPPILFLRVICVYVVHDVVYHRRARFLPLSQALVHTYPPSAFLLVCMTRLNSILHPV